MSDNTEKLNAILNRSYTGSPTIWVHELNDIVNELTRLRAAMVNRTEERADYYYANSRLRTDLDRAIERNEELTKAISKISGRKLAVEESMRVEREVGMAMRDLAYVHGMKRGWNLSDDAKGHAQLQRTTEVTQRSSLAVLRKHGRLTARSPTREGGQGDD